jgi:hypothetical protein
VGPAEGTAASTNSRERKDITSPRNNRATGGHETTAMAATIEVIEGRRMATSTTANAKLARFGAMAGCGGRLDDHDRTFEA